MTLSESLDRLEAQLNSQFGHEPLLGIKQWVSAAPEILAVLRLQERCMKQMGSISVDTRLELELRAALDALERKLGEL